MTSPLARVAFASLLPACWSGATPQPAAPARETEPPIVLALASGSRASVVAVSAAGATTRRQATLPGDVADLAWDGDDPIVLLAAPDPMACAIPEDVIPHAHDGCDGDPAVAGLIGRITEHGFVAYPRPPASAWAGLKPPGDGGHVCERDCWRMTVKADGVYEGHCIAAFYADGMEICDDFIDVKLGPRHAAPDHAPLRKPAPIAPAPAIALARVQLADRYDEDRHHDQLQCTFGGTVTLYPEADAIDAGMGEAIEWLSTAPPRFVAYHGHDGLTGWSEPILFEGCTPTPVSRVVDGPGGVRVVGGRVFRGGALLATVEDARLVVFAP